MACRSAPLSTRLAPLSTRLAPLSTRLAPLSTRLAPLSTRLAPLSTRLAHCRRDLRHCRRDLRHWRRDLRHCRRDLRHCRLDLHHCRPKRTVARGHSTARVAPSHTLQRASVASSNRPDAPQSASSLAMRRVAFARICVAPPVRGPGASVRSLYRSHDRGDALPSRPAPACNRLYFSQRRLDGSLIGPD